MKEIRALKAIACIAQSVERQPFKLVVVGSSPTVGVFPKHVRACVVKHSQTFDSCGIRTHALTDQRLKLAP